MLETFVVDQIREIGRDPDLVAATFSEVQRQAVERLDSLKNETGRLESQIAGIYSAPSLLYSPGATCAPHQPDHLKR